MTCNPHDRVRSLLNAMTFIPHTEKRALDALQANLETAMREADEYDRVSQKCIQITDRPEKSA